MWYSVPLQLQRLFGVSLNLKVLTKNCINFLRCGPGCLDKPMVINWPINSSLFQSDGSILCSKLTAVHTLLSQRTSPIQGVSHAIFFLLAFPTNLVLISHLLLGANKTPRYHHLYSLTDVTSFFIMQFPSTSCCLQSVSSFSSGRISSLCLFFT